MFIYIYMYDAYMYYIYILNILKESSDVPPYTRILNISDFWICLNMPKSAWMAFALHFLIVVSSLLEREVTYFNVYAKLEVTVWKNTKLFWKRQDLIFWGCLINKLMSNFLLFFLFNWGTLLMWVAACW